MKALTYMLVVLTLSFSGCSSQQKMMDTPPLELGNATCQSWTGGRPEAGSGLLLEIPLLDENLGDVRLQKAYFRDKITDVKIENTDKGWVAKANFRNQSLEKPDMVMHADSKMEVGNRPPRPKEKFPFELEEDQCVLSFLDGEAIKYFKVENIKEKRPKMLK